MFEKFLLCQAKTHNSFGVLDAAKMCYQAASGVAHIISEKARESFYKEYELAAPGTPVFEEIGGGFVRVNLGGWKAESLNPDWLYRLFCKTAEQNGRGDLEDRLNVVTSLAKRGEMPFSLAEWQDFLETYDRTPPSHSMEYKTKNNPLFYHALLLFLQKENCQTVLQKTILQSPYKEQMSVPKTPFCHQELKVVLLFRGLQLCKKATEH